MWADASLMAAQPNIGGALCECCVIQFLVPRREVCLTTGAEVPCSNAANIVERKTWTQSELCTWQNSVRGKIPRKCICSVSAQETAKHCAVWLASGERRQCSKSQIPLR